MIPLFPNFKKIEYSDRNDIEKFTFQFLPYSDFNFTSMWTWDTSEERMISKLNDNLIVYFTDYKSHKPFLSFLGTDNLESTVCELEKFSQLSKIQPVLCLVSQESILNLKGSDFCIEEDVSNFDYIFSISELANLKGVKFKEQRHLANRFLRENPEARFEVRELKDSQIQEQVIELFHRWKNKKKLDMKADEFEYALEEKAIARLLQTSDKHELIVSCVFLQNDLIGFSIDEILPFRYAISHFAKANIMYNGIYEFLNRETAKYLKNKNIIWWNWEQDLGIETIRKSKMNYNPVNFLKKYKVSLTCKD